MAYGAKYDILSRKYFRFGGETVKLLEDIFEEIPEEPVEASADTQGTAAVPIPPEESASAPAKNAAEEENTEEPGQEDAEEELELYSRGDPEQIRPFPVPHVEPAFVMGLIAALAAALLLVMVVLCLPYFGKDSEDPEAVIHHYNQTLPTQPPQETILEPTIPETEPENPTIPPDPNPYGRNDFQYNRHNYLLLQNLKSSPGIDVSAFQGDIQWKKVAASGIEFAIIRLGYRGYETGKLVEDEYAKKNLSGAADAGLKVGAYFFSQALNLKEVDEEVDYMLKILGEQHLDMPIVLDWEIPAASARTASMDARTLTDIQLHFIERMTEMGYQPMVYFNWHQSEHLYYLSELEHAPFWLALYQDRMTYPWAVDMWQYSDKGRVPGIQGDVDMNVYFPS